MNVNAQSKVLIFFCLFIFLFPCISASSQGNLSLEFKDVLLIVVPSFQTPAFDDNSSRLSPDHIQLGRSGEDIVLSFPANWEMKKISPDIFFVRFKTWKGFFWMIDAVQNQVLRVPGDFKKPALHQSRPLKGIVLERYKNEKMTPPESFVLKFSSALFSYSQSTKELHFTTEKAEISRGSEWEVIQVSPAFFHIRRKTNDRLYWKVDIEEKKVFAVTNGTFGKLSGISHLQNIAVRTEGEFHFASGELIKEKTHASVPMKMHEKAVSQVREGIVASEHFERSVRKMLYLEQFSDLEKMARDLRDNRRSFPDGMRQLRSFYQGISNPRDRSDDGWKRFLVKFDKWFQQYPDSVTAKVAAGTAWERYAWFARGTGFADTVSEEGWRLFRERTNKAYDLVKSKPALPEKDCPERYALLLGLANVQGWKRSQYEALFNEAVAVDPSYYAFYVKKATYLLPSWHGKEGEWQRFAKDAINLTPKRDGYAVYMSILRSFWRMSSVIKSFQEPDISWPLMKQGFLDAERNYPDSRWNLNIFCRFACIAADRDTARDLFDRIGNKPYLSAWSGVSEFAKCWNWAYGSEQTDKDMHRQKSEEEVKASWLTTGSEDFHQVSQLAKMGDRHAYYEIGSFYQSGEHIAKNYAEAVNWFRKAAEMGHPQAMDALGMMYTNGTGVQKDPHEAVKWYERSAMQGENDNGAYSLGHKYYDGILGRKDLVKAYIWYSQIFRWQEPKLKEIEAQLTAEQLELAKTEARKLKRAIQTNRLAREMSE